MPSLVIIWPLLACNTGREPKPRFTQEEIASQKFVGSKICQSCHEQQYSDWRFSHHDQAMKVADSLYVLGNFDNATFTSNGIRSTFFKKGSDYYVNTQGPDGNYHDYKIEYTFGVAPLQQYIVRFARGHFQCLQTAWDTEKKRWFDLQPNLKIDIDEWLHWTGGGMRWNTMCADCHSTNLHKNYISASNSYETTFSEISVGCEACHGPGSLHAKFYADSNTQGTPPEMYIGAFLTGKDLVDKCARCHSRRSQITKYFDYQGHFLDHYRPSLLIDPIYALDGQIRDEVYVYGSFTQSKMYRHGVSCKDCHDVHSLKLKQTGNALCLSCHDPKYDQVSHHFHEVGTAGASCINCHMTGKIYMGNDFRRDHSFRVPRPDQTLSYGTPNACNGCHSDKSAAWASEAINNHYGTERQDHFSDHLLAAYNGNPSSFRKIIKDAKYPEIARATALNQYTAQPLTAQELNSLQNFLKDTSDLVRKQAVDAFVHSGNRQFAALIEPLLNDTIRLIRISAARYFCTTGIVPANQTDFAKAEKEYFEDLEMNADFASGQHQIALYNEAKGNIKLAIKAYEKALEIDNYFNTARMNLALLRYREGGVQEAEQLYLKVIEQEPEFSQSYYMLGLLYHESGENEKALNYLAQACDKEPVNLRAFYNYALKLQEVGQNQESIQVMERALLISPGNEEFLYLKLLAQMNDKQFSAARNTCLQLLKLAPNNPNYKQILDNLTPKI